MESVKRLNEHHGKQRQVDPWWDVEVGWTGGIFFVLMAVAGYFLLAYDLKVVMYFLVAAAVLGSPGVVAFMRGSEDASLKGGSVVSLFLLAGLVVATTTHEKLVAEPEAVRRAAIAAANENGDAKARLAFQSWSAITEKNGTALTWSGETSEVVLVTREDTIDGISWNILARSAGGRFFEVWARPVGEPLTMKIIYDTPSESDDKAVVRRLTDAKRIDLIKQLNLPLKPA